MHFQRKTTPMLLIKCESVNKSYPKLFPKSIPITYFKTVLEISDPDMGAFIKDVRTLGEGGG